MLIGLGEDIAPIELCTLCPSTFPNYQTVYVHLVTSHFYNMNLFYYRLHVPITHPALSKPAPTMGARVWGWKHMC